MTAPYAIRSHDLREIDTSGSDNPSAVGTPTTKPSVSSRTIIAPSTPPWVLGSRLRPNPLRSGSASCSIQVTVGARRDYLQKVEARSIANWFCGISSILLAGCSALIAPPSDGRPELGPIGCPSGIVRELVTANKSINPTQAAGEVKPADIGLGRLASKIACVVRHDDPQNGASATVFMREGFSRGETRHALWDVGLDDSDSGGDVFERENAPLGAISDAYLTGGQNKVTLEAQLNVPHDFEKCNDSERAAEAAGIPAGSPIPEPSSPVASCRELTPAEHSKRMKDLIDEYVPSGGRSGRRCVDVTSYDYNWDNDMLCTRPDGTQFHTDYDGANAYLGR